jgi:hypothetical protein
MVKIQCHYLNNFRVQISTCDCNLYVHMAISNMNKGNTQCLRQFSYVLEQFKESWLIQYQYKHNSILLICLLLTLFTSVTSAWCLCCIHLKGFRFLVHVIGMLLLSSKHTDMMTFKATCFISLAKLLLDLWGEWLVGTVIYIGKSFRFVFP